MTALGCPQVADWRRPAGLMAAIFLASLAVYAFTAQRGVSWQDSGEFQYRVLANDFFWVSGIARSHPWYIFTARLFSQAFPVSQQFYAINLFSGVGMSVALVFLGLTLWTVTRNAWAVLIAAATLGFAHMAWWMSAVAEVYTWSAAFLLAEVYCLLMALRGRQPSDSGGCAGKGWEWWLALALVNGMHASLHNFAFLNVPVYGVLFLTQGLKEGWAVTLARGAKCAVVWLAGAVLLVGLFAVEWMKTGSLADTVMSLLFGREFTRVVLGVRTVDWPLAAKNVALAGVSLMNPCWLIVFMGWRTGKVNQAWRWGLVGLTGVHGLFWARYFVADQATFILPLLSLLAVWVGLGVAAWRKLLWRNVLVLLLALLCAVGVPVVLNKVLAVQYGGVTRLRSVPFRDEARYWLIPWKHHETSAARFAKEVQKILRAGDILVADNTVAAPIFALREAGQISRKIRVITFFTGETDDEIVQAVTANERAFIVSPVLGYTSEKLLDGRFQFQREGVFYRIKGP